MYPLRIPYSNNGNMYIAEQQQIIQMDCDGSNLVPFVSSSFPLQCNENLYLWRTQKYITLKPLVHPKRT